MPSLYPAPTEQNVEAFLGGLVVGARRTSPRLQSAEPEREPTGVMVEYVTESDDARRDRVRRSRRRQLRRRRDRRGRGRDRPGGEQRRRSCTTRRGELPRGRGRARAEPQRRLHADRSGSRTCTSCPGELSDEIKQLWRKPGGKRGYRVTVDDYGAGTVILYLS